MSEELERESTSLTPPAAPAPKRKGRTWLAWLIVLFIVSVAGNALCVRNMLVPATEEDGGAVAGPSFGFGRKSGPPPGVSEARKALIEEGNAELAKALTASKADDYRSAREAVTRAGTLFGIAGKLGAKGDALPDVAAILDKLSAREFASAESELATLVPDAAPADEKAPASVEPAAEEKAPTEGADAAKEPAATEETSKGPAAPAAPETVKDAPTAQ